MTDGEKKSPDGYFEELDSSGAASIRDWCGGKLTVDWVLQHWKGRLVLLAAMSWRMESI